jgi:hypothetical protein
MARTTSVPPNRVHNVFSLSAKVVTAAAALATVLGYVHSVGLDGSMTRRTIGSLGAVWLGLAPGTDTVAAIGDTVHLAATVTDRHGTALVGAPITWSSTDSLVASVADGLVVAHTAGSATIVAAVGDLLARATVVVRPRVAALHLASDSAVTLAEGETRTVSLRGADARGHVLPLGAQVIAWRSGDSVLASVDSIGRVTGVSAGRTTIAAAVGGVSAQMPITIVPVPGILSVVSGGNQDGAAGTTLPTPLTVRLTSRRGRPLTGVTVHFRRLDAGSSTDLGGRQTDGDGKAHTMWRLGDYPGHQRLIATVDGLDSATVIEAEAEPVTANTRVGVMRDGQSSAIVTALPSRVGIRLTDSTGRALVDVPVHWEILDSGSVTALTPRSDSAGEAEATWVLGPRSGRQRLRVLVGNGRLVRPTIVHATALPGPASVLRVVSGSGQHTRVGTALPKPVVFRVADAAGNAVPGVRIAITLSAGSIPDSTLVTDSAGLARAHWSMPTVHHGDALHLSARVDGIVQPVEVTATAVGKPGTQTSTSTARHRS